MSRILIIEDDAAFAESLRYALTAEGLEAAVASDSSSGLAAFEYPGVDLVLLDIGLPDGNGFDLFHRLRRIAPVPVIFLTARTSEIDRVVGLELGADDYVTKPVSPRELMARVRNVLRRATLPSPTAPPPVSPFLLDEAKRCIRYFGTPLTLTRYEYGLLRELIRRPGRVFTREELLERVWTEPEDSTDRTIDTHIGSLRAKLRAVRPEVDPILTHRGLGYALRERI